MSNRTREISQRYCERFNLTDEDIRNIESLLDAEARYWIERCAEIAGTEEVPKYSDSPFGIVETEFALAGVKAAKKCIKERILALLKETGETNARD